VGKTLNSYSEYQQSIERGRMEDIDQIIRAQTMPFLYMCTVKLLRID